MNINRIIDRFSLARQWLAELGCVDFIDVMLKSNKEFLFSQKKFKCFLKRIDWNDVLSDAPQGEKIGIHVSSWAGTAVPWFAILLAILYRKQGKNVCVIWDDILYFDEFETKNEQCIIEEIIAKIDLYIDVIRLSSQVVAELNDDDLKEIDRLAILKSIHHLQASKQNQEFDHYKKLHHDVLKNCLPKIKMLFKNNYFDCIITPGGVCGNSGLFYWQGTLCETRVTSYDAGSGVILIGCTDVAAHLMDIPQILNKKVLFDNVDEFRRAKLLAREEFELRLKGKDKFNSQNRAYQFTEKKNLFDIVIPLNVEWDTAALGNNQFFIFSYQWLYETIKFILSETTATIAVRQHPAEKNYKSRIFIEEYFKENFAHEPRCTFFPSSDEINTYELIENAKIVLPYASTVGVEAAMMGKQVIIESNCYYSGLPFVQKAVSKQDYFNKIKNGLLNSLLIDRELIEQAELCYYFTQICNWTFTSFTPELEGFKVWSKYSLDELLQDDVSNDILCSFSKGIPMARLNSNRIMKKS